MHNLYNVALCTFGVNALSLLYFKSSIAKLSPFVFGAEPHLQFVSICSCFICD